MKWEDMKESMGESWAYKFKDLIESESWNRIFSELKSRKARGIRTAPLSSDVFRAFRSTPLDNLRAIVVGWCPYHTFTKEGTPVADGIALSCGRTKVLQPSLQQLYSDLENTYSDTIDVDMIHEPDLSYLSAQGVLMYNVALTCQENKAGSDYDNGLWKEFDKFMWTNIINQYTRGLPIIYLGVQAAKSAQYLTPMLHYPMVCSHPASASYSGGTWSSDKVWLKADKILEENFATKISWYMRKEEGVPWL